MKPVICWWSGGVTSAVACRLAIDLFGDSACRVVMIDTANEHSDTYRFKRDCESWYKKPIETISAIGGKYQSIESVWEKYLSLNSAHGAICSTELKREVRIGYQKTHTYEYQVFGYEHTRKEMNRALALTLNWPDANPVYPLLMYGYDKRKCIDIINSAGVLIPVSYRMGIRNNNCLKTGCVQGGIGYWQHIRKILPDVFTSMAKREHWLTDKKGKPVTILKDQSNDAKHSGNVLVFLKKHPAYPKLKELADFPALAVDSLADCNGFCGTDDLQDVQKQTHISWPA